MPLPELIRRPAIDPLKPATANINILYTSGRLGITAAIVECQVGGGHAAGYCQRGSSQKSLQKRNHPEMAATADLTIDSASMSCGKFELSPIRGAHSSLSDPP